MSQFKELFTDIFQKNGLDQYIRDDIIANFEELTDIMIATNAVMEKSVFSESASFTNSGN